MNVTYSDRVKQSAEGFALLQEVTTFLEEVLGPSVGLVKAEWDQQKDTRNRTVYTLKLTDWSGSVSGSFAPEELQSPTRRRVLLYRLWGDLLQDRSHKQFDRLTGTGE